MGTCTCNRMVKTSRQLLKTRVPRFFTYGMIICWILDGNMWNALVTFLQFCFSVKELPLYPKLFILSASLQTSKLKHNPCFHYRAPHAALRRKDAGSSWCLCRRWAGNFSHKSLGTGTLSKQSLQEFSVRQNWEHISLICPAHRPVWNKWGFKAYWQDCFGHRPHFVFGKDTSATEDEEAASLCECSFEAEAASLLGGSLCRVQWSILARRWGGLSNSFGGDKLSEEGFDKDLATHHLQTIEAFVPQLLVRHLVQPRTKDMTSSLPQVHEVSTTNRNQFG